MKGIVSIAVSLILIGGTPCESKESCGGIFIDYPPEPPSIPRPHSVPDPASYKPLQILFIPLKPTAIDQESMLLFQEGFEYVNEKLSKILKTTRLKEIRLSRVFDDSTGKCDPPECSDTKIPGQYVLPCKDSNDQLVPEKNVTVEDRVQEYNNGQYSLVIYVLIDSSDDKCKKGTIAYATNCRRDDLRRPTHGQIVLCDPPIRMHKEKLLNTILHETFHVLLTMLDGRYISRGQPENEYGKKDPAKGFTWKHVTRDWRLEEESREITLHIPVTITPNVLDFVRRHFSCSQVEGAELELGLTDTNRVKHLANHWSMRLFNDDILAPVFTPARRITNLTLSFAKDTKWYDVDMSHAGPLYISKPQELGCDVATASCFGLLKTDENNWGNVQLLRPFCDRKMHAITPLCSPDGVWRLECDHHSDSTLNCDIAYSAPYAEMDTLLQTPIDHPKCSMATIQPEVAARYGLKVGPGTMCVTFINPPWTGNRQLMAVCVDFECVQDTLVLKFENSYGRCSISLKAGEFDNEVWFSESNSGHECRKHFPDLDFIVPEVNVVCSAQSKTRELQTTKVETPKPTSAIISTSTTTSQSGSVTKNGHTTWFMLVITSFMGYLN